MVVGLTMLLPLLVAISTHGPDRWVFALSLPLVSGLGVLLQFACSEFAAVSMRQRESFLFVTMTWVVAAACGSLPYLLYGCFPDTASAIFESFSGFSTTGATAMADIEIMPAGILVWRSLTHWLGGAGIVLIYITLIQKDAKGNEGGRVMKAEFSGGALTERVTARVEDNAQAILGVYLSLTGLCFVSLRLAGMNSLEALNHTLSTVATGGFSTRNASIAAFNSPAIEWVVGVFLLLSSVNLALYYFFFVRGRVRRVLRDQELRLFAAIVALSVLLVTADIYLHYYRDHSLGYSLRQAFFQVAAILTSGGFCSADYDLWPGLARIVLYILIFVGGCAGSTASSIKVNRFYLAWAAAKREIIACFRPHAVNTVAYNGKPVSDNVTRSVIYYFFLYFSLTLAGAVLCSAAGMQWIEAFSGCLASISNVGPALGGIGPAGAYAAVPAAAKYVMCFLMLAGRLEIYTVMVLFIPALWRK